VRRAKVPGWGEPDYRTRKIGLLRGWRAIESAELARTLCRFIRISVSAILALHRFDAYFEGDDWIDYPRRSCVQDAVRSAQDACRMPYPMHYLPRERRISVWRSLETRITR